MPCVSPSPTCIRGRRGHPPRPIHRATVVLPAVHAFGGEPRQVQIVRVVADRLLVPPYETFAGNRASSRKE
ncbi:hypothetical protein DB31_5954 [Hyalangium minutum]|uniref:Uncharacterized protein n=1 Tax=Hyalangium minutum TaxID=394096 RepID=A0A085VYV2_9BACT|nr:hypothetical protein DB31_5954 [Hyalangium minutum]